MVEDPKDSGSKKSAETLRLEQLASINLSDYRKKILFTLNPWPDDFNDADKLLDKLILYKAKLAENKKEELSALENSRMVLLYNALRGFSQDGLAVLCGITGRVFGIEDAMAYEKSREALAEAKIPAHISQLKEVLEDERKLSLKNAAEICFIHAKRAENVATKRYEALEDLVHNEGIIKVRGFTDKPSSAWPNVKERGVHEYKIRDGEVLRIAYYSLPSISDAPEDLVGFAYNTKEEFAKLEQFLKENNFDILVFNGSTDLIGRAIKSCNTKNKVTTSRFIFSRSEPKLKNKMIIVSNPKVHETTIENRPFTVDYCRGKDYSNLFIEGVNYKDMKMLLLDPSSKNTIYFAVISEPRSHLAGDSLLSSESRVFEGYCYDARRGNLKKVDFRRKEHIGESSSALHTVSSSLMRVLRGEEAPPASADQIVDLANPKPERKGWLSTLVPWVLGGAVGAGAVWAYYENKIIPGFRNVFEGYKQIVEDLRSK